MKLKNCLLIVFCTVTVLLNAQPREFEKIFHPQSAATIEAMKKSPQKTVIAYSVSEEFMNGDTANYVNGVKKYDANGRLVHNEDYRSGNIIKYTYDDKGRVTEYFEDDGNGNENNTLHFAVNYSKKGGIESIVNMAKAGKTISYNANTKAILITEAGGFIYRYTVDDENRLIRAETEYYQSRPYQSTLTYNKAGQTTQETGMREEAENLVNFTTTYTYADGKLIKSEDNTTMPGGGPVVKSVITTFTYKDGLLDNLELAEKESKLAFNYIYDAQKRLSQTNYFEGEELFAQEFYVYR